jgi:RimJ/RimL family protein N-acetyltransferase
MKLDFILVTIKNVDNYKDKIQKFFEDNKYEEKLFSPHPLSIEGFLIEIVNKKDDVYCFTIFEEEICAYGILRGWDEGFKIPSLGIMISKKFRGKGLSYVMMEYLHNLTKEKGYNQIRLRVYKENYKAISLYKKLGYVLTDFDEDKFIGFKTL